MLNIVQPEDRVVAPTLISESEVLVEESLRPQGLAEIIGMSRAKASIEVMIGSAKKQGGALDHILFHGPPGLGKTSLAMAVAHEMGVQLHVTSGPAITKPGELVALLTTLEDGGILFIDEIHRMRTQIEEVLYPAMEDRAVDIMLGKGAGAKSIRLDLPRFTILAATTKLSMLSSPLRSRFGADFRVDFYDQDELAQIIHQKSQKLRIGIRTPAAQKLAIRSRMTARIAVRILKRSRDLAIVKDVEEIDEEIVEEVLQLLQIDELGLDHLDREILSTLATKFSAKPVGLNTLSASLMEDADTIESVYEPYLLQMGLIQRTPKGRAITERGLQYIMSNKL